jgi:hypothetical protein
MSKPRGKRRGKKRGGKIVISQSAKLIHKNDATRVDRTNVDTLGKAPTQVPSNVVTFKVKVKRKNG